MSKLDSALSVRTRQKSKRARNWAFLWFIVVLTATFLLYFDLSASVSLSCNLFLLVLSSQISEDLSHVILTIGC